MTDEHEQKKDQEQPILSPEDARKWVDDLLVEQQSE